MNTRKRLLILFFVLGLSIAASAQGLDTAKIDHALGRVGKLSGGVYRLAFPRTDLRVVVRGVEIKPGLALGSWAAFSGTDEKSTVMGDLVLLQDEVNPVIENLLSAGFEITAVHNHLLGETPRIMYLHYLGQGRAEKLAAGLRTALGVTRTPLGKPATARATPGHPPAWVKSVEAAMARKGNFAGGVLSFGIPRANTITENGHALVPAQGVAESINFQQARAGQVATTGDFVLVAQEVNPVISALKQHRISVTALHSHMLTESPRLFFLHFWAAGSPEAVAEGIKATLGKVATR